MQINDAGLTLIKDFEQCRLIGYLPTPADKPTIGWGHCGPEVYIGLLWTQQQCDEQLSRDLDRFERGVDERLRGCKTSDKQFSAMVCLAYNIGFGDASAVPPKPGFETSSVLRRHKLGNFIGAANAFGMWIKQNGKILPGLIRRREAERKLYLA